MKRIPSSVVVIAAVLALTALPAGGPRLYADDREHDRGHDDRQALQALEARIEALEATVATLQDQNAALQDQVNCLQMQLTNAQNVLALDPFVSVDPNPQVGVAGPNITFKGANIHIVSGSGATNDYGSPTGLGNLIIGYDEDPATAPFSSTSLGPSDRSGSHNLVIGARHRFTQAAFGGLVAGDQNTISRMGASVSGGSNNTAEGVASSVSGVNASTSCRRVFALAVAACIFFGSGEK